ncbi:MAG: PadR family transcriptional regulator [Candidatus Heimdallarchaeota archaeon]
MTILLYDTDFTSLMIPTFSPTKILDSLILMQIVLEGPMHGYALTSSIEEKYGWKPSQTAVYNSLRSLESEKMVSIEERIEKGRAQKVYSITKRGRQSFEETRKVMKKHMMKNFSQFLSFAQMVGDIENLEESEIFQKRLCAISENMRRIQLLIMMLAKEAPTETETLIENTLTSLKNLAKEFDIKYQEEENKTE